MKLKLAQLAVAAQELLPDGLMAGGIAALSYGAALIYPPAGWIVAGGFSFSMGMLLARRAGGK